MRSSWLWFAAAPWIVAFGCERRPTAIAPAAPAPSSGAADAAGPPAPAPQSDGRLPDTVSPREIDLALSLDPARPTFSGEVTIAVDVPSPTWRVVLHARDLVIREASARTGPGGRSRIRATATMRVAEGGVVPEELVLSFAAPLPAGHAAIAIAYEGRFAADLAGLYRVQEDGRWYVFSQFEATDARRAFPCFDEPRFKTPYRISIATPRTNEALTNAPAKVAPAPSSGDVATTTFEETPPMPSYLVAFAVGPFESIGNDGPGSSPFPIRVVTTHGRSHLGALALATATSLVERLGEYFDMRYPYAKLDLVAVPDFAAGAMENPGLVTFRDALLLVDPEHATTSIRRAQASVIAHEFAHQWFGDLVTMRWWDDLWLNEGFATWAAAKIVDTWRPSFGATLEEIAGTQGVMDTDALDSARAVREPVRTTGEVQEAFDGITYDKGAAVLRMLESWLGPETFRRGVQKYVHDNAWKTARADDLFKAIDFVSTQPVAPLAKSFLEQTGVPEVLVSWTCSGPGAGKIELRESEWRPIGDARPGGPRAWTLPVCVETDSQKNASCFTLGTEPIARALGGRCPSWVYPNAGQAGYYRFLLDRRQWVALAGAATSLPPAERIGLVSNAWAAVRQGALAPAALLDVLPKLDSETNRLVVDQIAGALVGIDRSLVDDSVRPAYRKYVANRLVAKRRSLGWTDADPHPAGDDDRALERRTVLWTLGELAEDNATLREAEGYAAQWLRDPTSVSSDIAEIAVPLASKRAGALRLDELRRAAKSAKLPQDRTLALSSMGMFDDPIVLRKALDVILTGEIKTSEVRYVWSQASYRRESRDTAYAWEKEHWAELRSTLSGFYGLSMLVGIAGSMCAPADRDDAKAFFVRAIEGTEGARRPLDESLERAGLCIQLRRASADGVAAYFGRGWL